MNTKIHTAALLYLVLASCAREAPAPMHVATGFTASLPSGSPGSRTSMKMDGVGTGTLVWDTDDAVMLSNGSQTMSLYVEEGGSTTAALYARASLLDGTDFYAVYPSASTSGYESGVFTVEIPSSQNYVPGGFDRETFPMVALCDDKRNFEFRNAASLISVVPSSDDSSLAGQAVARITITAAQNMAGTVSVAYEAGHEIETKCTGTRSVSISGDGLRFGDPVFFVVAPGSYTEFTVRVTLQNGFFYKTTLPDPVTVDRSRWRQVEAVLNGGYTDLSEQETANCYVITKPGSYRFRANVRGNGRVPASCTDILDSPITDGQNVYMYHLDGEDFLMEPLSYAEGYIFFTTVEDELPTGSMLVSLRNAEGITLWSWHIWANPQIADVALSNGQTWMNMNLGALHTGFSSNGYNGYYYQWGRKDPFIQKYTTSTGASALAPFKSHASQADGSIMNAIEHPEIFYGGYHLSGNNDTIEDWAMFNDDNEPKYYDLWNMDCTGDLQTELPAAKTMFDPCPAGYHVPVYSEVEAMLAIEENSWSNNGKLIDGQLFFPASSYRYINIYSNYWVDGSSGVRAFFWCALPHATTAKKNRRAVRPWFTTGAKGIGNGPRTYAIPVRCIKDQEL